MSNQNMIVHEDTVPAHQSGREKGRKRVAVYCRVSTELESQQSSLELQMTSFQTQIAMHPDWKLVDIYADEGISGTRAEIRPEFQRMIRDCEAGKIDYIITKSISRFARNTLQCLSYIRQLRAWGVQLFFEKENIDTGTAFSEVLLTIMAAFAQEESHSLSENAKWGIRKRFEAGIPRRTYVFGYTYDQEGNYVIVPEQAETVRHIFNLYEMGCYSMKQIAQILMEEKRPSAFCDRWGASHVQCILNNEKYIGDVLMQKKYTVDHLTHKEAVNRNNALPSYYLRDHHVSIVSRKQYDRVQKIAALKSAHGHSPQYPYADLLVCPICGERLIQHRMNGQDGKLAWHCDRSEKSCGQYVLKTTILDEAVLEAYQRVDMEQVRAACHAEKGSEAAQAMIDMKQKNEFFMRVDFYWLDELVEKITFGKERIMSVHWKYGATTTVMLPITNMRDDPIYVAGALRQKRERMERENELLNKASDLMASDMPRKQVVKNIMRATKKFSGWASK